MANEKSALLFASFKKFLEEGTEGDSSVMDPFDLNAIFQVVAHGATLHIPSQFLKWCSQRREFRSATQLIDLSYILLYTILHTDWPHAIPSAIVEILETIYNSLNPRDTISNLSSASWEKLVKIVVLTEPYLSGPNFLLEAPVHVRGVQLLKLFGVFKILSKRSDLMTDGTTIQSLRQLVQHDGRDLEGQNLLLLACDLLSPIFTRSLVPFLLYLGASPYSRNDRGNGVFHLLAITGTEYWHHEDLRDDVARYLLDCTHGHGLDMMNEAGMTAADLWFRKNTPGQNNVADLPEWLQKSDLKPNALKCLSAAAVRRYKVPYDDGTILPAELISFVSKHFHL